MAQLTTGTSKSVIGGINNQVSLDTVTGLEELATEHGYKESKVLNALDKAGRVLNFGTANVAGAVRGAVRGEGFIAGAAEGRKENLGFAEVHRDLFGEAETKAGKAAVGIGGFAADVLFDPLTYITFGVGAGAKVGGKVLTKGGTRMLQGTKGTTLKSTRDILIEEGHSVGKAKRMAQTTADKVTNELFAKATSKKGLTKAGAAKTATYALEEQLGRKLSTKEADDFINSVVNTGDIDNIMQMGTKLIDEGGIKYFGKTLVKSETLANTVVGRAGKRLGETEIAVAVKNTAGNLFVSGYKKNKQLQELIGKAKLASRRALSGINDEVDTLFKDFNEVEDSEFFNAVFDKRTEVLGTTKEIQEGTIKELNKMFPELKVKDKESALRLYESFDDVHHEAISKIHKQMEDISKAFFDARSSAVQAGKSVETPGLAAGKLVSLQGVDKLTLKLQDAKAALKEIRKGAGSHAAIKSADEVSVELTDETLIGIGGKVVRREEERLTEEIDKVLTRLEKIKADPESLTKGAAKKTGKKASDVENLAVLEEAAKKLEKNYATKVRGLAKIIDAKRIAKASQLDDKLRFFKEDGTPNVKLNKVADKLFEGNGAIIRKLSKEAGISEEDAFKYYLPSKFRDQVKVKEFAMGRFLSSPSTSFKKDFTGVANDNLIRSAKESLKRGKLEVRNAKIKSRAIHTAIKSFGIKDASGQLVQDLTKHEAARMGVKKFSRKTMDGEISGFIPKEIFDEVNEFLTPAANAIDDAAKAMGFDWATGIFKGYVTSLFPAFHMRNMISNQFQLFLKHGVNSYNPAVQKRAFDLVAGRNLDAKFVAKDGKEWTNGKLLKAIRSETDFLDEGAFGDTEQMLRGLKAGGDFNPLSANNVALKTGRNVGTKLESQSKIVGILNTVMEGGTIKQGIADAEDVLFNYGKITDFERSIMRRLIPFYTFARKNFELQAKMLATNPGRVAAQMKFMRGAGEAIGEPISEEDKEGLPSWIVDSLGIKAGANQYGQSTFLTGFGLPIEEFLQRFSGEKGFLWNATSDTMTRMNPLLKFPMERATGVDFFRGRPITELTNARDIQPLLDVLPGPVEDEFKSLLQYKEREVNLYVNGEVVGTKTKVTANPFALHLFRNLPTARMQSTAGSLYDNEETGMMTAIRMFTGVKGWTIDQEEQKFFNDLDKKKNLQDFLVRMGVLGIKEIPFEKQ